MSTVTTNERNILGEFNFFTSYMSQPKSTIMVINIKTNSIIITINERPILGEFNFFTSYMSQPKFQLETFKVNSESRY